VKTDNATKIKTAGMEETVCGRDPYWWWGKKMNQKT